jgi:hypothetical protein
MFEGEERANGACNLRSKCFAFHGMDIREQVKSFSGFGNKGRNERRSPYSHPDQNLEVERLTVKYDA